MILEAEDGCFNGKTNDTALILADRLEELGCDELGEALRNWYSDDREELPHIAPYYLHRELIEEGVLPYSSYTDRSIVTFHNEVRRAVENLDRRDRSQETFATPVQRAADCRKRFWEWIRSRNNFRLHVRCYRRRPTPRAVQVIIPRSKLPVYAHANDRAAQDMATLLAWGFPNYPCVHIGETADRAALNNYDWVVI
jgi:hypothetical protein